MDVFRLMGHVITRLVQILDAVPLFGMSLWRLMIGIMAASIVVSAVLALFSEGRGGDKK